MRANRELRTYRLACETLSSPELPDHHRKTWEDVRAEAECWLNEHVRGWRDMKEVPPPLPRARPAQRRPRRLMDRRRYQEVAAESKEILDRGGLTWAAKEAHKRLYREAMTWLARYTVEMAPEKLRDEKLTYRMRVYWTHEQAEALQWLQINDPEWLRRNRWRVIRGDADGPT